VHTQDNQGNAADRIPLKKEEDGFFSEHVMETSGMDCYAMHTFPNLFLFSLKCVCFQISEFLINATCFKIGDCYLKSNKFSKFSHIKFAQEFCPSLRETIFLHILQL
jgi:hypothetical protein